jgi:lysophospholipase L1-like esterase
VEPLARFRRHWEARGVPVVFVFMPLHPGLKAELLHRTGADHAAWKAAVVQAMAGHVLDAEDRLQDPRMFRDGVHLNAAGARRMSGVMREELQGLGWALPSAAPASQLPMALD